MDRRQARRREAVRLHVGAHGRGSGVRQGWRDGPEAARACCARRVCVREAAHVRLGPREVTMAIELAERRNAIVCVEVVA